MQDQTVLGFLSARRYEVQALILVHSLRQFGAKLSDIPVWIYAPEGQEMQGPAFDALKELNVEIIPFDLEQALWKFPFTSKAMASALAEERAEAEGVQLAWHDRTKIGQPIGTGNQDSKKINHPDLEK